MTNSHGDDDSHHHRSARQRLSRIAGQLGGALVPVPVQPSSARRRSHNPPNERALSISKALGGVVSSSTSASLRGGTSNTPNPHLISSTAHWKDVPLPRYRDLPREGGFPGCAWDVWGKGDVLGTLNLLEDHVRAKAAREEIRSGISITLSWPMHLPLYSAFNRTGLQHKAWGKSGEYYHSHRSAALHSLRVAGEAVEDRSEPSDRTLAAVSDDEVHFNTQCGSQWDGFAHFGHLSLNCFYGGRTRKDVQGWFETTKTPGSMDISPPPPLSIHSWAQKGIAGRGVLLDIYGFLTRNNNDTPPYDPFTSHAITLDVIRNCARAQGVVFRQGDILILRTGWIHRYYSATDTERREVAVAKHGYVGVEQGDHVCEFLWDTHFAAVASDAPAFERWPCPMGSTHLHETLLAMFGMPIGEFFDLEALVKECQRTRRWTFYFSSWPLNNVGGVASLANAGATF